jgi:Kef-type K+ transport system membrane component KefB
MRKSTVLYFLMVLGFGSGIYFLIQAGKNLETSKPPAVASPVIANPDSSALDSLPSRPGISQTFHTFRDNLHDPLSLLLVQLIIIVVLARVFGSLFVRIGQPAVIGEMVAGIVLGPSLAGTLFPGFFHFVFAADSLGSLRMLSQVGVILFMFVVGMELDLKQLRNRAQAAVVVSHASILFPYFLGVLLSFFIYRSYASGNATFLSFSLFMGIAMSITAFPVLARIIEERGLTKTYLGATAITCAAVDDATAWSILAFVVAIAKAGTAGGAVLTILLVAVFVALMLLAGRPMLARFISPKQQEEPGKGLVVGILILVFIAALYTEVIGIHALFGAFLVGVAMPANARFRLHLKDRLENFSSAFLLPLFFAFTGLRTQVGLLNDWESAAICLAIICVATLGKLGGGMLAARWTGMNWHDSFALGALMNTRGLVELIVLNVGLDLGILSPRIFAMMVIMALVTTFMTGPLLSLGKVLRRKSPKFVTQQPVA